MVSLKNASDESMVSAMKPENYGYGLRIWLNDAQCKALGITAPPAPGSQVTISAKALVCRASSELCDEGKAGNEIECSLQITDMEVKVGAVRKDAATVLYGSGSGMEDD